jgi:hypothetical protein
MSERVRAPASRHSSPAASMARHGARTALPGARTALHGARTALLVGRTALLGGMLAGLVACGAGASAQQDWDTMTSSRSVSGESELRVTVEYGAGTLHLASGQPGSLYRADLRYDRAVFSPRLEYDDQRLRVGMSNASNVRGRNIRGGELDVLLSPDVPLDLVLQFGAADATLDLGGLRIRSLELQTGASRTVLSVPSLNAETMHTAEFHVGAARFEATGLGNLNAPALSVRGGVGDISLDFTGAWPADMTARVEMGLGSLNLRVPRGLGVQVNRGGALSSFDGQELMRRDNSYYSENFAEAERKLIVTLEAALGRVRVVWVD